MKKSQVLHLILGGVLGGVIVSVLNHDPSGFVPTKPMSKSEAPTVVSWDTESVSRLKLPVLVQVTGRLWSFDTPTIQQIDGSLDAWNAGVLPFQTTIAKIYISDDSITARQWWYRICNGAICDVAGLLDKCSVYQRNGIGNLTRLDQVTVLQGIGVQFEVLMERPDKFHDVVIRIDGVVGTHPTVSGLFLYKDENAWISRDFDKTLVVERQFVAPSQEDADEFEALFKPGTHVKLDALYQRPFKDDPIAPNGKLVWLHRLSKP